MYFPLCGFLVLFSHAIGNPNDPNLASDLKLMDLVTSFLTPSSIPMSPFSTSPSIEVFHELNKIAKRFVDKNYRKNLNKAKRVHEDIDSEQSKWQQPRDKLEVASIQSQADTTPVTNYSTVCLIYSFITNSPGLSQIDAYYGYFTHEHIPSKCPFRTFRTRYAISANSPRSAV